jgi:aminoglycoside phosphotransferase (APT) family kinase protein
MAPEPHLDTASFQRFLDQAEAAEAAGGRGGRGGTVTAFRPISGGFSRLSALATVRWGDGTEESFVLRSDPPPGTGVFDSDRDAEHRLLKALAGQLPIHTPTPRWYDATGEYFGAKTLVVDFFRGRPLPEIAQEPDGLPRAAEIFIDTLSEVHKAPLGVLPPELERPADWKSYLEGLAGHLGRLDGHLADSEPALHYVAAQLLAHEPPPVPLTLVHGDAQPANILVPDEGEVLMIDWEFGRVGDPREDLGYYSHLPVPPNLYEADPKGFLARYRERTGLTEEQVNEDTVAYFYILGMARLLGQMLEAADALAQGRSRGVMATYMMNGISATTRAFVDIARRLKER